MNKGVIIAFVIVAVLVLATPFLGKLGGNSTGGETEPPAVDAPTVNVPLLNAANLAGTAWNVKGFTVELYAGGQAQAAGTPLGTIDGNWSVAGSTLTVTANALGQTRTFNLEIVGDQIMLEGKPVQRVR